MHFKSFFENVKDTRPLEEIQIKISKNISLSSILQLDWNPLSYQHSAWITLIIPGMAKIRVERPGADLHKLKKSHIFIIP